MRIESCYGPDRNFSRFAQTLLFTLMQPGLHSCEKSACHHLGMTIDTAHRERLAAYRLVRNLSAEVLAREYEPSAGLMLGVAGVRPVASESDLENVPAAGPCLIGIAAGYGALGALAAAVLLDEYRPDAMVFADQVLAAVPNLRSRFIGYDPWTSRTAAARNTCALRKGVVWLRSGGALAVLVEEKGWPIAVRLARLAEAAIVPASIVRPGEEPAIELRIGAPLGVERLARMPADDEAAGYLRWRANLLARRDQPAMRLVPRCAPRARYACESA